MIYWPVRAWRAGADVRFDWIGAADPAAYGLWRATTRQELVDGPSTWTLAATVDGEGPGGKVEVVLPSGAEPALGYYLALARDPCTNAPVIP